MFINDRIRELQAEMDKEFKKIQNCGKNEPHQFSEPTFFTNRTWEYNKKVYRPNPLNPIMMLVSIEDVPTLHVMCKRVCKCCGVEEIEETDEIPNHWIKPV